MFRLQKIILGLLLVSLPQLFPTMAFANKKVILDTIVTAGSPGYVYYFDRSICQTTCTLSGYQSEPGLISLIAGLNTDYLKADPDPSNKNVPHKCFTNPQKEQICYYKLSINDKPLTIEIKAEGDDQFDGNARFGFLSPIIAKGAIHVVCTAYYDPKYGTDYCPKYKR